MEYRPLSAGSLFGHAWTLGIEEKFYLAWPLILAFLIRRPLIALAIAAIAVGALFITLGSSPLILRGYAGLGFGAMLAMIVSRRSGVMDWLREHAIAGYLLAAMAIPYALSVVTPAPWIWNVLVSFCGAGVIASLWFNAGQRTSAFLSLRPLAWLGRLTYAIYLIQSIVIRIVETILQKVHLAPQGVALFAVVYPCCVLAAWAAHVVIEKPLIAIGKRLAKIGGDEGRPQTA
jgi:peptidoglycan/LPS O-acetylase OafA/YrhL